MTVTPISDDAVMAEPDIPYDEIDEPIRSLVRVLNAFPGTTTIGSCGGHEAPGDGQAGPGRWWVLFSIDRSEDGWLSLEFLAWAVTRTLGADGSVTLEADAAPPYLNEPGRMLRFVLERHHAASDRQDADEFARQLDQLRQELFIDAQLATDIHEDGDLGDLAPARHEGSEM